MGRLLTAVATAADPPGSAAVDVGTLDGVRTVLARRGERLEDYARLEFVRGRNTTVTFARADGEGIVVKQHRRRTDSRYEAERLAHRTALRPYAEPGSDVAVPQLLDDEPSCRLLVFDLVPEAVTLTDRLRRSGRPPRRTMELLGAFLGELHAGTVTAPPPAAVAAARDEEERQLPRYGELDPEIYATLSDGERRLARAIQADPPLLRALDLLAATVTPACRIHGDLRPENVLLRRGKPAQPAVIDWELTRVSDPAVDLGRFAGCLVNGCLEQVHAPSVELWSARSGRALSRLAPALATWWDAYVGPAAALLATRPTLPFLAMSHAGATIIGLAAARAHDAGTLQARDWLVLRCGRSLMLDPLGGARRLLGLGAAHA